MTDATTTQVSTSDELDPFQDAVIVEVTEKEEVYKPLEGVAKLQLEALVADQFLRKHRRKAIMEKIMSCFTEAPTIDPNNHSLLMITNPERLEEIINNTQSKKQQKKLKVLTIKIFCDCVKLADLAKIDPSLFLECLKLYDKLLKSDKSLPKLLELDTASINISVTYFVQVQTRIIPLIGGAMRQALDKSLINDMQIPRSEKKLISLTESIPNKSKNEEFPVVEWENFVKNFKPLTEEQKNAIMEKSFIKIVTSDGQTKYLGNFGEFYQHIDNFMVILSFCLIFTQYTYNVDETFIKYLFNTYNLGDEERKGKTEIQQKEEEKEKDYLLKIQMITGLYNSLCSLKWLKLIDVFHEDEEFTHKLKTLIQKTEETLSLVTKLAIMGENGVKKSDLESLGIVSIESMRTLDTTKDVLSAMDMSTITTTTTTTTLVYTSSEDTSSDATPKTPESKPETRASVEQVEDQETSPKNVALQKQTTTFESALKFFKQLEQASQQQKNP